MAVKCPIKCLTVHPYCEYPWPDGPWPGKPPHSKAKRKKYSLMKKLKLTPTDEKALHQFANRVIAAGRMLYKKVPRAKAEPMVRRKWLEIATELRRR
jgi:hypothetical protein